MDASEAGHRLSIARGGNAGSCNARIEAQHDAKYRAPVFRVRNPTAGLDDSNFACSRNPPIVMAAMKGGSWMEPCLVL